MLGFLPNELGVGRGVRPEDGGWTRGKGAGAGKAPLVFMPHPRCSWRLPPRRPSPTAHAHSLTRRPPPSSGQRWATLTLRPPSPPAGRTEEVAVPQQPYQNHSSCYLPSFLPGLVLHVWHLAVSLPLWGGRAPTRRRSLSYLGWDATTRRSRSPIAVFALIASSPSHPPRLRFSLPRQNMRPAREDGDDDGMPGPAGHAGRPVNDIPRDRSLPHFMRCPCVDGYEQGNRVDIMLSGPV